MTKSSTDTLKRLLKEIAEYHNKELNDAVISAWTHDLAAYSEPRVRDAWMQHRRISGFFPGVHELLKFLAPQAVDLGGFKPTKTQDECSMCGGTGWKDVTRPVDKSRRVERCECRRTA